MLLTAALAYARHGIPVLPVHSPMPGGGCSCGRADCDRPGKHPRLRHGLSDASTDPRRIAGWWRRWPDANVGLRTGIVMDVADVDSAEGRHGLRHLLGGAVPPGPQVRTGGGGWHFWFTPLGYGNRVRLRPGLDWRGSGGYVVAPPSRHASGHDYIWLRRPGNPLHRPPDLMDRLGNPLPVAPAVMRELIAGPPPPTASRDPAAGPARPRPAGSAGSAHHPIVHPRRYALAALQAESSRVAGAVPGTRNDTLNRAAFALGRLVGAGMLDDATVVRGLTGAARYAGLGRAETRRTVRSGLTAGRRQPLADASPMV